MVDAHSKKAEQIRPDQTNLEHLDERYTEVKVSQVAANKAAAVKKPDRHDGTHVCATRHLNIFPAVKHSCGPGQDLCRDGGEGHVPACQKYRCTTTDISHRTRTRKALNGAEDTDGTLGRI